LNGRAQAQKPDHAPWAMDEIQRGFERIIQDAEKSGHVLTAKKIERIAEKTVRSAGRSVYRTLMESAPKMLLERRKDGLGFERRNIRRWRKAFDLIETIWVSCEELGRAFNEHYRPEAVEEQDYVFEAMTHLHAKALLVTSEIICLLKGGFADGALTRWRTLYEVNVVAALMVQEGQELALRYLAHSRVQAWNDVKDDALEVGESEEDRDYLRGQAEYAIARFGTELNKRNGWACGITGNKSPTFDNLIELSGRSDGRSLYKHASLHIHSNHRGLDELLGVCESEKSVLLVGQSNSGMVMPLTMAVYSIVETTTMFILTKPNLDRGVLLNSILRMVKRMNQLAGGIERRTFAAAKKCENGKFDDLAAN
jgi:hypothetical protein